MPYRNPNKPPFASWLVAQREARPPLKAEEVARRLREAGLQAEDSTYRTWESASDRRPAPETMAALERMFGSRAPGGTDPAGDLVVAIRSLVEALDRDREERMALTRAIAALAQSLARRPEDEESPEAIRSSGDNGMTGPLPPWHPPSGRETVERGAEPCHLGCRRWCSSAPEKSDNGHCAGACPPGMTREEGADARTFYRANHHHRPGSRRLRPDHFRRHSAPTGGRRHRCAGLLLFLLAFVTVLFVAWVAGLI